MMLTNVQLLHNQETTTWFSLLRDASFWKRHSLPFLSLTCLYKNCCCRQDLIKRKSRKSDSESVIMNLAEKDLSSSYHSLEGGLESNRRKYNRIRQGMNLTHKWIRVKGDEDEGIPQLKKKKVSSSLSWMKMSQKGSKAGQRNPSCSSCWSATLIVNLNA
jgi:hypothetical protein